MAISNSYETSSQATFFSLSIRISLNPYLSIYLSIYLMSLSSLQSLQTHYLPWPMPMHNFHMNNDRLSRLAFLPTLHSLEVVRARGESLPSNLFGLGGTWNILGSKRSWPRAGVRSQGTSLQHFTIMSYWNRFSIYLWCLWWLQWVLTHLCL